MSTTTFAATDTITDEACELEQYLRDCDAMIRQNTRRSRGARSVLLSNSRADESGPANAIASPSARGNGTIQLTRLTAAMKPFFHDEHDTIADAVSYAAREGFTVKTTVRMVDGRAVKTEWTSTVTS